MMTTRMSTPLSGLGLAGSSAPSRLQSVKSWLVKAWQGLVDQLVCDRHPEPRITRLQGQDGEYVWEIYDAATHTTTYCLTDYDVMVWLDSRYHRQ